MTTLTTLTDLRNWVDAATNGWWERSSTDVDRITSTIQRDPKRPDWGMDWTEYLASLELETLVS